MIPTMIRARLFQTKSKMMLLLILFEFEMFLRLDKFKQNMIPTIRTFGYIAIQSIGKMAPKVPPHLQVS